MEFKHVSVLLEESIEGLNIKPDGVYADGTLGGGGHSEAILKRLGKKGRLIGIDRDMDALKSAGERLEPYKEKITLVHSNYADIRNVVCENLPEALGGACGTLDGAVLDLGVSSYQLDVRERGFSYMQDAPLDMRMDQSEGMTAEELIATYSEDELCRVIADYGEERWARRIAQFIVAEREKTPITSSAQLVEVIKKAVPHGARRDGPHPAKRTFQAIRIELNDELGLLDGAIRDFVYCLKPGGRLCVITFHSLEDRIVKQAFQNLENPCTCPKDFPVCMCGKKPQIKIITRKPIEPSEEELEANPRARSAKLRICEKIETV